VSEALDLEGHPVVTAANGAQALEVFARESPSLVLFDMRMPVVDGFGFVRLAREHGWTPRVIVMTAAADARSWASEIRAQGMLAKLFDLEDLLVAVERLGPGQPGAAPA